MEDLSSASARVQRIVEAAERAAEQLQADAEERVRARIAEGDRAADMRVEAAEAEALEIVAAAHAERDRLRVEGEREAAEALERAREQARELVAGARAVAEDVMDDGGELARNLHDLSTSLRVNAERLLRDVAAAHASLIARLDDGVPPGLLPPEPEARGPVVRRGSSEGGGDFDVPEFIPRR